MLTCYIQYLEQRVSCTICSIFAISKGCFLAEVARFLFSLTRTDFFFYLCSSWRLYFSSLFGVRCSCDGGQLYYLGLDRVNSRKNATWIPPIGSGDVCQSTGRRLSANLLHLFLKNRINRSLNQLCQCYITQILCIYIFSLAEKWEQMKDKNYLLCHKLYQFLMEAYKKKSQQNETQIIQHIKNIARDLFQGEQAGKKSNKKDDNKRQAQKYFVRTTRPQGKYKQFTFTPNAQSQVILSSTLSQSRSKSKKKPIFANFDDLWSKCRQSPPKKEITPIMDRINKNIYSRFKIQNKASADLSQNILNSSKRQEQWKDFLKRQQQWEKERKKCLRQNQMKVITRQSPSLRKRINTVGNLNTHDDITERQMSSVQISLKRLRLQTQKLRLKILKIDEGINSDQETYHEGRYRK